MNSKKLVDLPLLPTYRKGRHDIARQFYLPCMSRATRYDRAVGFFNSSVFALAWPALRHFLARGGTMRLLTSPVLAPQDEEAMRHGHRARIEGALQAALVDDIKRMLANPTLEKPSRLLGALVAEGRLEVKIAFLGEKAPQHIRARLYHDKVGFFHDDFGGTVLFKGSMNETWAGLSADGNLESVDVFLPESARERERVRQELEDFEMLWGDSFPGVTVVDFPEVAKELLVNAADTSRWKELLDEICTEIEVVTALSADVRPGGRTLRPHQVTGLRTWLDSNRRGILEHATGSGKTFTALSAMRDALQRREVVLVLVPAEALFHQWHTEITENLADFDPQLLLCGSGNTEWKKGLLALWTRPNPVKPRVILAMMPTACSDDFLDQVQQGDHLFVVADEVHRLGSPEHRKILGLVAGPRLGLSATPRRAGDPIGTEAILSYFERILEPAFTLSDAIRSDVLVPYTYTPWTVSLTSEEQEKWDKATLRLARAIDHARRSPSSDAAAAIHRAQIDRARIMKDASGKVPLARSILASNFQLHQKWLVYCDNLDQLARLKSALQEAKLPVMEYYAGMEGDRQSTLKLLETNGGVVLSVRCLDEGVDIPSVTHALILASSQNPREFIQRRGRVLRRAPTKAVAVIHDSIVLPYIIDKEDPATSILNSELARAVLFGRDALNPGVVADLQRIALNAGIDPESIAGGGVEND